MLKIKDDVDLSKLKKFGFIKSWSGFWVITDKDNYIIASINPITYELDTDDELIISQLRLAGLLDND
ncbi:MAG: hypothetical protein V8R01_06670 [Bacilli bacterium]